MRKLFTVFATATLLLLAGSFAWKAEAAPLSGVADLPPFN
jgi:hypothetical protein